MSLQEQLDELRAKSKTRIPPEAQAVMQRSIDELRASGILNRVPKVGDRAPDFTLPNAAGQPVSLAGLLAKGPVVVSFYRGRW
jgi:AhpC/TSA family